MESINTSSDASSEHFDLVIVGAGIYGLMTAKTFLDIQPSLNLVVVDRARSVGGVWAAERIYPGLNAQTTPAYFELPYFKLKDVVPPVEYTSKGFPTGPSISRYLAQWAEKMELMKHIRLNTAIGHITRDADKRHWQCHVAKTGAVLSSEKLIVANGISSIPNYPNIDYSKFTPPVMHYRDFGVRAAELEGDNVKAVAVYGSGKGSWDIMVQLVKAGKKVKWITRKEGRGMPWIMEDKLPNGKSADDLGFSRILSILLPSVYQNDGFSGLHYFFKRNFIGKAFASFFMNYSRSMAISTMGTIDDNMKNILPELPPFWMYHPLGVNNYDVNIYDLIRNGDIEAIKDTIISMEDNTITLASGESLPIDAVVFATGWKAELSLFKNTPGLEAKLGLPSKNYTDEFLTKWKGLEAEADKRVYALNPLLKSAPAPLRTPHQESGPFRLYHYMIPTDCVDRSIAFLGIPPTLGTIHLAIVQSLWTAAYMMGKLELPSKDVLEQETAYELRYTQIRCVGLANEPPYVAFDFMSWVTMHMRELGINPFKKGGWWKELSEPYSCADYEHLTQEWMEKHGFLTTEVAGHSAK